MSRIPPSRAQGQGEIINLTDRRAATSRDAQLDLLTSLGPDGITQQVAALVGRSLKRIQRNRSCRTSSCRNTMTYVPGDVVLRRLRGSLAAAANCGPVDFPELLLVPGVGARTVRALALVAEVVHGTPCRFSDPARFSLAHGGKDRHPFPVPLRVYDETLRVLKSAVHNARLGREEELGALKRLDQQARQLEACG